MFFIFRIWLIILFFENKFLLFLEDNNIVKLICFEFFVKLIFEVELIVKFFLLNVMGNNFVGLVDKWKKVIVVMFK